MSLATMHIKPQSCIEVCVADLRSVSAATEGGADRVELCSGLPEGGVTPSLGMVKSAMAMTHLPVRVLIRPRPGDFTYNDLEIVTMLTDIRAMADLGVAGFVVGALTPERSLDINVMKQLIDAMDSKPWTLHRAFDYVADPFTALQTAIDLGADTVLTSGQAATAPEGAGLIARLVQQSSERIHIMAGGGVTSEVFKELYDATHCTWYHLSGRARYTNQLPENASPKMNHPALMPDHLDAITDPAIIRTIRNILNACNKDE